MPGDLLLATFNDWTESSSTQRWHIGDVLEFNGYAKPWLTLVDMVNVKTGENVRVPENLVMNMVFFRSAAENEFIELMETRINGKI